MSDDTSDPITYSAPTRATTDRKRKLGRGLGALLGEANREEPLVRSGSADSEQGRSDEEETSGSPEGSSPLRMISLSAIDPLDDNPRKHFDETALEELAASIAKRGVIQPIIVRPRGNGRYQLVAGERRWRAAQKARLHEIPALVRELEESEVVALALIENLQREDLNPVEEARAYQRLSDRDGMTQAEIARMVEKSRSHVANVQRLLALPDDVLDLVESGELSMGHARALIGRDDAAHLAKVAVAEGLSVRDVEGLVRGLDRDEGGKSSTSAPRKPVRTGTSEEDSDIAAVQRHLEEFLGLKVQIRTDSDPRSGSITIRYNTLDQLDLVCQRLTGGDI
ncbi:ParB/RepB/Spo0J family partition protein [Erythrobacter sp.]|uniref:ParB/RepB/Spo0J family partition protein n=1 Tax=Erythrobacter sp. TaxID=1042 RepID=UPI003C708067